MTTIEAIRASIARLRLAGSVQILSECAAVEIIDPHTLAVVPFADRDTERIYHTIAALGISLDVNLMRNAITLTI